ncbi:unnamed protein product [Rotaria sp. Silwood1]|nr:unnamed protein product [Rotaria sp. Silwood1]CAF3376250.1 unnamed protein product [Rotaria sp. Silwood1]CAF3730517.1 unnamed protein product [Rotaria sp. Silwood1]CAF4821620.1 unnamed protein product [Rotaria sp. Silwood1]CAF4947559.1 unnamed protein product [Rotaria sp. Silwood1]
MMTSLYYIIIVVLFALTCQKYAASIPTYPIFPKQAQFTIESIVFDAQDDRNLTEYIYDYDYNRLTLITQKTIEYYNYKWLQKAVYSLTDRSECNVYPIDMNNSADGFSAITDTNTNKTHIRSLQDFLLLTSNATYLGDTILRGFIHVEQWITSISIDTEIIFSFSKASYAMPWNNFHYSIPVQRILRRKSDGSSLQTDNFFDYRVNISSTPVAPPKGIYCKDWVPFYEWASGSNLGIQFSQVFSVRIDISTSIEQLWRSIHLRYHKSNDHQLVRYDYTPNDLIRNPVSIIFDYADSSLLGYTIDRRTGSCRIEQAVNMILSDSILHEPMITLINYEDFLLNPTDQIFQYVGIRPCRSSIMCSVFIKQENVFPSDPNEDWLVTNIEYSWSKRQNNDSMNGNNDNKYFFDYPVELYFKLYRRDGGIPADVSFQFYDYRTDVYLNEFDIHLCYRSNQLLYNHLAFQLKLINRTTVDDIENVIVNRRHLVENIREQMISLMEIKYLRISQVELDHHTKESGHNDTFYCIFTLLDRTPYIDETSEVGLIDAQMKLERSINEGKFRFVTIEGYYFEAIPYSLENVEHFYPFNPNVSVNEIQLINNMTTIIEREEIYEQIKYSSRSQALAIVGGMLTGFIFGTLFLISVFHMVKKKSQITGGITYNNISFRLNKNRQEKDEPKITMEHPMSVRNETDS